MRLRLWSVPICLVLTFAGAYVAVIESDSFQDCIERAQYKASQTPPYKNPSSVPVTLLMRERCIGSFVNDNANAIIALFTIVLAGSTIGLWFSTEQLWKVSNDTLDHAEKTAQRELRAYVHLKDVKFTPRHHRATIGAHGPVQGAIHTMQLGVILENSGHTPTRKTLMNINHSLRTDGLPITFDYPSGTKTELAMIGPHSGVFAPIINLPAADIVKLVAASHRLFVWGWVDYDDVFPDTSRHRTEFCLEVIPDRGMPITDENTTLRSENWGPFNGADGDCQRQPDPFQIPT
jgi:hypothetical protein